jgi:hypothetical protein
MYRLFSLKDYLIIVYRRMIYNVYKLYITNATHTQSSTSIYVFYKRATDALPIGRCNTDDFIFVNEIKQSGKKMLRNNDCSLVLLETTDTFKEAITKAREYRTQFKEKCVNAGYNKAKEKEKNKCYYTKNHQHILTNQRKKTECPHCNLMVRSYYLKKHLLTSKCKDTFFHYELNENIARSGINPFQILPRYMTYDVVKNTLVADTRIYKLRKCQFKTMCRILEERALEFIRFTL